MAVHHILDDQVAGAPFWKTVAPEILRPDGGVLALAAHRAAFEQRYCRPRLTGGADWICTWKVRAAALAASCRASPTRCCAISADPEGLVHEMGLPAHRALPDAYVTAHHLRDMLNAASVEQLLAWSHEPGLLPRVPAGADRGKAWRDLGDDALRPWPGNATSTSATAPRRNCGGAGRPQTRSRRARHSCGCSERQPRLGRGLTL